MEEFDKNIIEYILELSKIYLTDKEKEKYLNDFKNIIIWINQLNEIELKDINITNHCEENLREDNPSEFKDRNLIIENFTDKESNFLKTKKVIDL